MPRLSEEARRQRMAARSRLVLVLNTVFNGQQRRMADALGVSQAQLSRIVSGRLGPSPELLAAVARTPGISPAWVLHGEGEAMLTPTKGTLPVSPFVLPGPPLTCPHLLSGSRHMVAEVLDRETRYYLQVQETWPLVQVPAWKISPGDLLLMETAQDWTGRLDLILGRFCGVRVRSQSPTPYEVGRLEREGDGVVLKTRAVVAWLSMCPSEAPPSTELPPATVPTEPTTAKSSSSPSISPVGERPRRKVLNMKRELERAPERQQKKEEEKRQQQERQEQAQKEEEKRQRQERQEQAQKEEEKRQQQERQGQAEIGATFTVDDIVAVCLYLARPMMAMV